MVFLAVVLDNSMSSTPAAMSVDKPTVGRWNRITEAWLGAATIWYLTGLLVALGFSLGFYLVRQVAIIPQEGREPLDAFTWMDGHWYTQIATEGYHYDPDARSNIAFFPVYPLLGRAVAVVTGLRTEAALLIVSNVSLLGALVTLYFYVHARYRDAPAELADWAVLAAALFPTGCFFRLAYSESTFLLLTLASMYGVVRRWPLWANALIVGLATAARPVGVALLAAFAIHVFRRRYSADRHGRIETAMVPIYLVLSGWGLLAFMSYQYTTFGDPLASVKAQRHWTIRDRVSHKERAIALPTLEPIRAVYDADSPAFWASADAHGIPWFSLQFANPLFFIAAVVATALGTWRRWLTLEETALTALLLSIPYVTRAYEMGMGSAGRFVAVGFPLYLIVGRLLYALRGAVRAAVAALLGFFLAAYTALYAAGYAVF
jgi:hypothetical protein